MLAHPQTLNELLHGVGQFVIPIFQRPYAWSQVDQWEPLWLDITGLAERALEGHTVRSHFLGALVLDHYHTPSGTLQRRWVIDGQQRLTTIQLLMAAFAATCDPLNLPAEKAALAKLIRNEDVLVKTTEDSLKVLPAGADREHFINVMQAKSPEVVTARYSIQAKKETGHRVVDAYRYFQGAIERWLTAEQEKVASRAAALRNVLRDHLRIVTIDLTSEDDGQLIFETLNARNEPLLPSDLAKNLLFRNARDAGMDIETLYSKYWRPFDTDAEFWRKQEGRGHARRARIDTFLFHYLTARQQREVRSNRIYPEFRDYATSGRCTTDAHFEELHRYARSYRDLVEGRVGPAEQSILRVVQEWSVGTALPLLLELRMRHFKQPDVIASVVRDLESFIVRRAVCRLNTRSYGALFAELVEALSADDAASEVRERLRASGAEIRRWPDDDEFRTGWTSNPMDGLASVLLYGIEEHLRSAKTEDMPRKRRLQVEHVMPRAWAAHWPLPIRAEDGEARERRDRSVRSIGNLTLLTNSLNPSLGNAEWNVKREAIEKHSVLMINRELVRESVWDESRIMGRTVYLFELARKRWPHPST